MCRDVRLTVDVDVFGRLEAGGEVVFDGFDDVFLEVAVHVRDDRVEVGNEDVDIMVFLSCPYACNTALVIETIEMKNMDIARTESISPASSVANTVFPLNVTVSSFV